MNQTSRIIPRKSVVAGSGVRRSAHNAATRPTVTPTVTATRLRRVDARLARCAEARVAPSADSAPPSSAVELISMLGVRVQALSEMHAIAVTLSIRQRSPLPVRALSPSADSLCDRADNARHCARRERLTLAC